MPRILFRFLSLISVVAFIDFVSAMPVDAGSRELKATGGVGETVDGFLGIVNSSGQGVAGEVNAVNAARLNAYRDAAADTGRPLADVQAVAGARLREKAQPGDWIQNAAGEWMQKR